jgi:uncharacterized protein (TIGR02147 family)
LKPETPQPNPKPWRHLDYREYLREFYEWRKERRAGFSYRAFSVGTGVQSPNYLKLIIDGQRNLTRPHARRVAKYCQLKAAEAQYFLALVEWNQAKRSAAREKAWKKVLEARQLSEHTRIPTSKLSVLTRWQAVAILEMLRLKDFRADAAWIRAQFHTPISESEITSALDALLTAQLIEKDGETLRLTNRNLVTDDDIPAPCIRAYHRNVIEAGIDTLENTDVAEREFISTTLAIRESDIPRLKENLREFRDKLLANLGDIEAAEQVYQVNIQLFPITKRRRTQ